MITMMLVRRNCRSCAAGISRSATVIIGFLMQRQSIGYDEAFRKVRVRLSHQEPLTWECRGRQRRGHVGQDTKAGEGIPSRRSKFQNRKKICKIGLEARDVMPPYIAALYCLCCC